MLKEAIRLIQAGPIALGYNLGRGGADGWFGNDTKAGVQAWLAAGGYATGPCPAAGKRLGDPPGKCGPSRTRDHRPLQRDPRGLEGWPRRLPRSATGTAPNAGSTSAITGSSIAMARCCGAVPRRISAPIRSATSDGQRGSSKTQR